VVPEGGATPAERDQPFPCDRLIPDPYLEGFRAVDVAAPVAVAFRWLCQLRVAPYSYDWIDNWGRRSPRDLTPGVEELREGQRVMSIFRLIEFERDRHITLVSEGKVFGTVGCTYRVDPAGERSRIVVKVLAGSPPRGPQAPLLRLILAPGDLIMMRRQLLNLAQLAERSAAA
jgi:hypothetical protein